MLNHVQVSSGYSLKKKKKNNCLKTILFKIQIFFLCILFKLNLSVYVLVVDESKAANRKPDGRRPERKVSDQTSEHKRRKYFVQCIVTQSDIKT